MPSRTMGYADYSGAGRPYGFPSGAARPQTQSPPPQRRAGKMGVRLGYLVRAPVLLLDALHLVLEAQLELLQAHFFQFLIFGQVAFLDQGIEALRVLRVLLNQLAELFMAGQELVPQLRCHPEDLLDCRLDPITAPGRASIIFPILKEK